MNKIAFIGNHIQCGRNRAQFQRSRLLIAKYNVEFYVRFGVCPELADKAKSVKRCPGSSLGLPKLLFPIWAAIKVLLSTRERQVRLVYTSHHPQALLAGYLLSRLGLTWVADIWDTPNLGYELSSDEDGFWYQVSGSYHNFLVNIVKKILNEADLIIVGMVKEVLKYFGVDPASEKILSVTNGVDLEEINNLGACEIETETFELVYVGHIQQARGINVILEAARILVKNRVSFRLKLVGPVKERARDFVESSLVENDIDTFVDLTGEVSHKKALNSISKADVALCTLSPKILNYRYAYPIKLFEYMALGKPVVCTKLPGTGEIIENGVNGILVPPDDPTQLAKAIMKLYDKSELRTKLGKNAIIEAQRYDWYKINSRISQSLDCLLG